MYSTFPKHNELDGGFLHSVHLKTTVYVPPLTWIYVPLGFFDVGFSLILSAFILSIAVII